MTDTNYLKIREGYKRITADTPVEVNDSPWFRWLCITAAFVILVYAVFGR